MQRESPSLREGKETHLATALPNLGPFSPFSTTQVSLDPHSKRGEIKTLRGQALCPSSPAGKGQSPGHFCYSLFPFGN